MRSRGRRALTTGSRPPGFGGRPRPLFFGLPILRRAIHVGIPKHEAQRKAPTEARTAQQQREREVRPVADGKRDGEREGNTMTVLESDAPVSAPVAASAVVRLDAARAEKPLPRDPLSDAGALEWLRH